MAVADRSKASPLGTRHVERFLRRLFALAGPTPADHVRGDVSPSIEVRPAFPWDERDFGMISWTARIFSPAVAARLSYFEIAPPGATPPTFDICIDRVVNVSTSSLELTYNNATQAGANITAMSWGARDSTLPGSPWQTGIGAGLLFGGFNRGDIAALAGYNAGIIPATASTELDIVLRAGGNASGAVWVAFNNPTVNTAAFFQLFGRAIPTQADLS